MDCRKNPYKMRASRMVAHAVGLFSWDSWCCVHPGYSWIAWGCELGEKKIHASGLKFPWNPGRPQKKGENERTRDMRRLNVCTITILYIYILYIYIYRRKSIDVRFFRLFQDVVFQNAIATYTCCCVQTNGVHTAKPRGERRWLASPQKDPCKPSSGPHHSGTNDRSAY